MNSFRPLTGVEKCLLNHLINSQSEFFLNLPSTAKYMNDGGMGSLTFDTTGEATHGKNLIEAEYMDSDGTPILITLILDKQNNIFELDFFKADFSGLITSPTPEMIKIKRP